MNANFMRYCMRNGAYALNWLIKITGKTKGNTDVEIFYVNNNEDVIYNAQTYKATAFDFTPNKCVQGFDGGGKLEITARDSGGKINDILQTVNTSQNVSLEVIGVFNQNGEVTETKSFAMNYGSISISRDKISFTFEKDDRLQMTFPALIFSHYNNRGN